MITNLFYSPRQLIVGDAQLVGVLDIPGTHSDRPPIRLYFPATTVDETINTNKKLKQARYFVDNRAAYILQGFVHIAFARHTTKLHRFILRPLLWLLSFIFPPRWLKIPDTVLVRNIDDLEAVKYATPKSLDKQYQNLVIFSHGLTGTGEENTVLCTSLAKRGYVVCSIHHRDGSSSRVPLSDGSCLFYQHFPTGEDYDPKHRLEQVNVRAQEFLYSTAFMMGEEDADDHGLTDYAQSILNQIRPHLRSDHVVGAGFSYGAATTSLAATLKPQQFKCAILLDPWLHIDYSSKGYEFDFPPESFGNAWPQTKDDDSKGVDTPKKDGLNVPTIIINSAQFAGYTKLYGATTRLAKQINDRNTEDSAEMHIIPDSTHQNFVGKYYTLLVHV